MRTMTFGSLFAGIGGFDLGFERAGLHCAWSVEIDDRCNKVRAHHWPDVKQYKDVRDVGKDNLEPVDVICGGFPCQDLSVAGRRAGLAGERSGLWWEFHRIIEELSPRWAIIENVPGLLSSNSGRDMGTIVGALGQLGYGYAWTTLDAQFFGVAQRRRRVFIVGCLGNWRGAPQVLFEPESGCRDSAPSRETGEDATRSITKSLGSGSPDDNRTQAGFYTTIRNLNDEAVNLTPALRDTSKGSGSEIIVQHALSGNNQRNDPDGEHFVISETGQGFFNDGIAPLRAEGENRPSRPSTIVFEPRYYTRDNKTGGAPQDTVTSPLTAQSGEGDSAPVVAYGFSQESDGSTVRNAKDLARPITGRHGDPGVVAWQLTGDRDNPSISTYDDIHPALATNPMSDRIPHYGVRRLTPLECERLQGFPDTWTAVNGMSDSARYRMLGNAVAVPVAEWIGRQIQDAEF